MVRIDLDKYKPLPTAVPVRGMGWDGDLHTATVLQDVVDKVFQYNQVHWYSYGDWSMHQLLIALLKITGPADVMISSYAFSETPTRAIAKAKIDGLIKRLDCVIDSRVETRTAGSLQLLRGICDGLALISTHAKATLITSDSMQVTVIGSANYTENKRYEAGVISASPAVYNFHYEWIKAALHGAER